MNGPVYGRELFYLGGVAEWLKAAVLKTVGPKAPQVRILSPPFFIVPSHFF